MTDYVLMPGAHYRQICETVREKTGKTQLLRSQDLAEEIRSLGSDGCYDMFWDTYQQNGQRTNYYQMFVQNGWDDSTFCPKYPITCKNGSNNGCAVFYNSRMTQIPVPIIVTNTSAREMFNQCTKLETVSRLVLEGVADCNSMFSGCSQLRDLNIEGSIDVNFSLAAAGALSAESVQKVLDCLRDLTGDTTQTLMLHNGVGSALTEEQKTAITAKNWTLAY